MPRQPCCCCSCFAIPKDIMFLMDTTQSMAPYIAKCIEIIDELMKSIAGPARAGITMPDPDNRCRYGFAEYRDFAAKDKENEFEPGFNVYDNWGTPGVGGNGYGGNTGSGIVYANLIGLDNVNSIDAFRQAILYGGGDLIGLPLLTKPFFRVGPNSTNNNQTTDPKEEGTAALTTMALQWSIGGTVGGDLEQILDADGNLVCKRKRHIVWFGDQPSHEGRVNRRSLMTDPAPSTPDPIYAYYPTLAQTRAAVSYGKVRIHAIDCANLDGTGQMSNLVSLTKGSKFTLSSDTAKELATKICAAIMEQKQGL